MNINKLYSTVKKSIKSNSIDKYKFDYQKSKEKFRAIFKDSSKKSKQLFLNSLKASNNVLLLSEKLFQNAQDRLEQRVQRSKEEVSVKPSTIWAQAITYSLISGTTFGIGWLALAKTEEIVITQGKLEPIAGVIPIKIPLQGVTKQIFVKEGEKVKAGQLLIELDTEATRAKQDSLIKSKEINKNILDKLSYLLQEGAVSEVQYLQQKLQLNSIESEITKNNLTLKYQRIKAPIDGTVFNLIPQKPGYVANTGEPIMEIVPSDNLQARVEINSSKIGFVKVGKKADISIDSFPASDFGIIGGTVTNIGSDALPPKPSEGKGYRFPADVILNEQYLSLKSGEKLPLQAGMSLTANIKLRKVSYLKLLLNKFSDKADSLRAI